MEKLRLGITAAIIQTSANCILMNQYMVVFYLPPVLDQEFLSLIPDQRKKVNELMQMGSILSYTLSKDRAMLWAVVHGESEEDIEELMEELPLTQFVEMEVYELFFHNSLANELPVISLN